MRFSVFQIKNMGTTKTRKSNDSGKEKGKKNWWQWTSHTVEHLVKCLKEYKVEMDYKNVDFKADVVALYTRIRTEMTQHFCDDEQLFGPVSLTEPDKVLTEMSKEELKRHNMVVSAQKLLIRKGYNPIKEKSLQQSDHTGNQVRFR